MVSQAYVYGIIYHKSSINMLISQQKCFFCAYVQHNEEATVTTDNIIITF